ncbi:MAG: phage regulatory CII family protein [Pseudomonadota bacterium]
MNSQERAQRMLLEPHQAAWHAAKDWPGGVKGIAAIYGVSATILANKLNPNYPGNTLDLKTALMVWEATRDPRIPEAFADHFGGCFVPDGEDVVAECAVLSGVSSLSRAMASMVDDVATAFADGHITPAEEAVVEADAKRLAAIAKALSAMVGRARKSS